MEDKIKKIAVSSTGKDLESEVDIRFGRCPFFLIIDIEDNEIKDIKTVENKAVAQAGGAGITAAQIVADEGVEAIITGNVGPRAYDVFSQLDIRIFIGEGKIEKAVQDFIEGRLEEVKAPTGPQHRGMGRFQNE